jgi:multimeric flavodoxin WrbA
MGERYMLIVGINGSPQKGENTDKLLMAALEEAKKLGAETKLIQVSDALEGLKNPFCTNCSTPCSGACYKGTNLQELFETIGKCDGMILASPVYFGTVSAQLKAIFDKSRKVRSEKKLINVIGGALAVGASRFGGQETTVNAIHDMMFVQGMTVVGDGFMQDDAGHQGACGQKPIENDESAFKRAKILARRVVEVAEVTKPLRLR